MFNPVKQSRLWGPLLAGFVLIGVPSGLADFEPMVEKRHVYNACLEAILDFGRLYQPRGPIPEPDPLPIGCTLPDCGPGAGGAGPIDLRITLSGELAESVFLDFTNLAPQAADYIRIYGDAKRLRGGRFRINRGMAVLGGLRIDPKAPPTLVVPRLVANNAAGVKLRNVIGAHALLAAQSGKVHLRIQAFRGSIPVYDLMEEFIFKNCRQPKAVLPSDQVHLINKLGADEVLLLVPGRRSSGCQDYETISSRYRSNLTGIAVGNLMRDDGCHSEVVVFSKENRMEVLNPVNPAWNDEATNTVRVFLSGPLQIPITVWVLYDPRLDPDPAISSAAVDPVPQLLWEIGEANTYYQEAKGGMSFSNNPTIPQVTLPAGRETDYWEFDTTDVASVQSTFEPRLKNAKFYSAGSLNVYLMWDAGGKGATSVVNLSCTNDDPNCDQYGDMIFLSQFRDPRTLAHEFGHTFELLHTTGVDGFDRNLMHESEPSYTYITKGQSYRANVDQFSFVNTQPIRVGGFTRTDCPRLNLDTSICPELAFDQ